ncbi:Nn.00g091690.m01.CDS01 [Neocucurbitaria sp. VM-36]
MALDVEFVIKHVWALSRVLALFIAGLYVFNTILFTITSPLRSIPGPLLARFTRLWYLRRVRLGQFHDDNVTLHRKYGSVVRIAPNQYSIDDPEAIRPIYGHGTKFTKSDWYRPSGNPDPRINDLFSAQDTVLHAALRRKVANLYSTSTLIRLEDYVDECISLLIDRFSEIARKGEEIDLQFWMQCYAFDVIGYMTCGKRFGFLDAGKDEPGMFASLHSYLGYAASVGIMHEFHRILFPVFMMTGAGGLAHLMKFTQEQISESKVEAKRADGGPTKSDFLSRMVEMHNENPEKFTDADLFATCMTNIGAGSDTTSISLCAVLYSLMTHPDALAKLRREIQNFGDDANAERDQLSFQRTQKMPYLQACIKEAMRLHPATGLPLSRVVPKGGAVIAGRYFPAGAVVGVNTWVAHRNTAVFGADADQFRPERWLEESKERLSRMDDYYLPFGHGSRTCIGKNISLLEMNKLVPLLVDKFNMHPVHSKAPLHCQNVWFVKQTNLMCRLSER